MKVRAAFFSISKSVSQIFVVDLLLALEPLINNSIINFIIIIIITIIVIIIVINIIISDGHYLRSFISVEWMSRFKL